MANIPEVKLGLVAVSRDCFPVSLSEKRRGVLAEACKNAGLEVFEAKTTVENEKHVLAALDELKSAGVNALVIYLGNFGPEGPETMLAQKFGGPTMFASAAEETQNDLIDGRGDAYCGMLNASYSLGLRGIKAYIPEYPVGLPEDIAKMIGDFENIARAVIGLRQLKVISFGPRPFDFLACNAPIRALYDLGVEIQENSELDLLVSFKAHEGDARIPGVVEDMKKELADGINYTDLLPKLAQYEITLLDWAEANRGASESVVFANKCWPAFQTQFGFCPCYVNSRLTGRGIPVACETDIYGAVTEFIIACATGVAPTLLDINNSVPRDMFESNPDKFKGYDLKDTFMGFHCGNTAAFLMKDYALKYQLIQKRTLEPDLPEPNVSRGTLEGAINPGKITLFRLQSTADTQLRSYIAEGEIVDVDPKSFGGIGVFAVPEMGRFYRHVLIEKRYPHHAGIAFGHAGKVLFEVMKLLGVGDIAFNQPKNMLYKTENPFA